MASPHGLSDERRCVIYEQQKAEFEAALIRSELQPVPGHWWLTLTDEGVAAIDGRCCALSPACIERNVIPASSIEVGDLLGISNEWGVGAVDGFDGSEPSVLGRTNANYQDGWEWGQMMRHRYVEQDA